LREGLIKTPIVAALFGLYRKKIAAAGVHLCAMNFAGDGLYLGLPYSERVALTLAAFD
jgi:hypothetical protein